MPSFEYGRASVVKVVYKTGICNKFNTLLFCLLSSLERDPYKTLKINIRRNNPKSNTLTSNLNIKSSTMYTVEQQVNTMRNYYRFQSRVYDLTRWSFLFGRKNLLAQLQLPRDAVVLELGCGTGYNLRVLAEKHPDIKLIGVDVSPHMLARSAKATQRFSERVQLIEKPYGTDTFQLPDKVDVVLFSYALTMFNPGWDAAIDRAWEDLRPGGLIAVVDFNRTPFRLFRLWLENNHVRFDGHLLPYLRVKYRTEFSAVLPAYSGLWSYFLFLGTKH